MAYKADKVNQPKPGLFKCEDVLIGNGSIRYTGDVAIVTGVCPRCSYTHLLMDIPAAGGFVMLSLDPRDAEEIGKRLISPVALPDKN